MASELTDVNKGGTGHKLLGDEGVAKIVNLGVLDAGEHEEAVDARANISDEERIAGLGNEDVLGAAFRANVQILIKSGFGGRIEGDFAGGVGLVSLDSDLVSSQVEVGHGQVGELGNTHTGLKKQFNNGGNAGVGAAGVAKGAVFEF